MKKITRSENNKSVYVLGCDERGFFISRSVKETGATSTFGHYTLINKNYDLVIKKIDRDIGESIIREACADDNLSSALIVVEDPSVDANFDFDDKTAMENLYTSTGEKFFYHPQSLDSYKNGKGRTVISTHVSPEGRCNLRCPYCSVAYRTTFDRIEFRTIRKYLGLLRERGLKAVILTGGGEPTLYPQINELIELVHDRYGMELAMITNGTSLDRIFPEHHSKFSWLRVSVNIFPGWEDKISIPAEFVGSDAIIGFSYILTCEHAFEGYDTVEQKEIVSRIIKIMDRFRAKYLRILPNCLVKGSKFNYEHKAIARMMSSLDDKRIFHQLKTHEVPNFDTCYQSYFRPYLSEERNRWNGKPGCVFPCDSVVLNESCKRFEEKFALCEPGRIVDYLDGRIKAGFDPRLDCQGCVFVRNNCLLFNLIKGNTYVGSCNAKVVNVTHKNFV